MVLHCHVLRVQSPGFVATPGQLNVNLVKLATGRGALVATKWENPLIEVTYNRVLSVASFTEMHQIVEVVESRIRQDI